MLTIFAIPKPFSGHIGVIQRNAIHSWTLLRPACEIILFGNDEGIEEIAAEFSLRHVPEVACNEYGTPFVNVIFGEAQKLSTQKYLCYVNSDIILMNDFMKTICRIIVKKTRFLVSGRHWKIDINQVLSFDSDWENRLRDFVIKRGQLDIIWALDYFIFPRETSFEMPQFVIGRPGWDNWLLYKARALSIPIIDVTEAMMAVHQNHDYLHVPSGSGDSYEGPEADINRQLAKEDGEYFGLLDATYRLKPSGLKLALERDYLRRHLVTIPILYPKLTPFIWLIKTLIEVTRPVRLRLRKISNAGKK